MNTKRLRLIIPLALMGAIAVGFATHAGIGTLSAIGWQDISILCPLGALLTMVSAKAMIPRAVLSLILAVAFILLFARAFCGWVCPVPVVSRIRGLFSKKTSNTDMTGTGALTPQEVASLSSCGSCSSCAERRSSLDSRHVILGGSVLSAAVFGFPVFCLICPIGLTFATIVLVMRLFSFGDVTWGVVLVPALLAAEVIFFRKWCSKLCPLSALQSLIGKGNRTFVPTVDEGACREGEPGAFCEVCASVCPQGINVRHPEAGMSLSECTKCRACVEACPTGAISMPLVPRRKKDAAATAAGASPSEPGEGAVE